MLYRFAGCSLDCERRDLIAAGQRVHLEPQVFDVLQILIENHDRVVSRDELIDRVWQGRIVSEATIGSRVFAARKAVGDTGDAQAIIRTMPRRGFRFVAAVQAESLAGDDRALGNSPVAPPPRRPAALLRDLRMVLVTAALVLLATAGVAVWVIWEARVEPASLDRMAYPLPGQPSIAVLPFASHVVEATQASMAEALTESIINTLGRDQSLFVIAHSSTQAYAGQPSAARRAAEELGVRYILEGSVSSSDGRARVTTELVDAVAGVVLWSGRYDRASEEFFDLVAEITAETARNLDVLITHGTDLSAGGTRNLDAWNSYVQGRTEYLEFTSRSTASARAHFEQAILADPIYADAMVALAKTHLIEIFGMPAQFWGGQLDKIDELAGRADAIAPELPQLFELRAYVALARGDLENALKEAEAMVARYPNSADSQYLLGQMCFFAAKYPCALAAHSFAERMNPSNRASYSAHMAFAHLALGRTDVAVSIVEEVVRRWPEYRAGHAYLAILYQLAGREAEARQQAELQARLSADVTLASIELRFSPMRDRKLADEIVDAARRAGIPG